MTADRLAAMTGAADLNNENNMKTIAQQLKITTFPFTIKDNVGDEIYFEDHNGYWSKREYDSKGNIVYYENSIGIIQDNRPKSEIQKAIDLLTKEGLLVDGKVLKN